MFSGVKPTFRRTQDVLAVISQEDVFYQYLGIYPDLHGRFKSPFRVDRDPGCRFKWHSGILYFIENRGFNDKLYWSCIDVVQYVKQCSYQEALEILYLKHQSPVKIQTVVEEIFIPEIRFEKKQWTSNLYNLSGEILEKENVFLVKNYWIKFKNGWARNSIHHPDRTTVIAYYFPDTNHVKLYFPFESENRWYSNCSNRDIFGWHKLKYYHTKSDTLYIAKSGKDRLMLDYFIGVSAIALQNEGCYIPDDLLLELTALFPRIIFLYDSDIPGITQSQKLSSMYKFENKIVDIKPKDPYEWIKEFGVENTKKLIL